MSDDSVIIPFPEATHRERIVKDSTQDDWVSPYTGEQALGIVIFNNVGEANISLSDALTLAKSLTNSLKPMGFTVEFTGVKRIEAPRD